MNIDVVKLSIKSPLEDEKSPKTGTWSWDLTFFGRPLWLFFGRAPPYEGNLALYPNRGKIQVSFL